MSLTNPKTVVTEERLAEFYQGILPYLGGNYGFSVLSKFNKSDLYSSNEQLIGRWIDGKPLYQKTVTGTTAETAGNWAKVFVADDIDKVVNTFGKLIGDNGIFIDVGNYRGDSAAGWDAITVSNNNYATASDKGKIFIKTGASYTNLDFFITVQYTKTTDVSINIGSDTDYSETEKIIGTWIDGKPIYQKTVDFGQNILISNTTWTTTSATIQNGAMTVRCYGSSSENPYQGDLLALIESGTLKLQTPRNGTGVNASVRYCTVQYTKTSD